MPDPTAVTSDLGAALAAVRGVRARWTTASDDELLGDLAEAEAIGRVVDAWRVAAAAEVERRSNRNRGEQALSFRSDASDGVNLVARSARIPLPEAKRRVGLGAALAPETDLRGAPLPGRYTALAAAMERGEVGVGSARVIVESVQHIRKRVQGLRDLEAMVEGLTEVARGQGSDAVEVAAAVWRLALDPDGPRPDESGRDRNRSFRLGRTRPDGMTPFSGLAEVLDAQRIREALQSRRRGGPLFRTTPGGGDDCEQPDPEWREGGVPDPRSRAQQDYDTLIEVLGAGLAAEQDGHASTAVTHEVVVTVTAEQLEARRGRGWMIGALAAVPMPTVERMTCSGGVRVLVTGGNGEPLHLSRTNRVFSAAQKKALIAASGGVCAVPGCTAGAAYLEGHHVDWWHRDDGPTDIGNGVLLCGHHHALVHASASPIRLVRHEGDVYVVPRWRSPGPPEPWERRQRGPGAAPPGPSRRQRDAAA